MATESTRVLHVGRVQNAVLQPTVAHQWLGRVCSTRPMIGDELRQPTHALRAAILSSNLESIVPT